MLAVRLSSIYSVLWAQVAADDIIQLTRVIWYIGCISPAGDIVVEIIFFFAVVLIILFVIKNFIV